MVYAGNPHITPAANIFFMQMILIDSDNELATNLGEPYLII